ncbi:MAG: extracellular solute-binding protein [Stappiaceae bacterium]
MKFLRAATILATCTVFTATGTFSALAEEPEWQHATALTGDPKYPEGFKNFDYVNPDAPKGGRVRLSSTGGFDTFNPILSKGNPAPGVGLIYDRLMAGSLDEINISAEYGLIAEATRHPEDDSWVEFRLDPNARWHDGKPITPEDVVWSYEKAVEVNPNQRYYYQNVEKAEITGEDTVRFTFNVKNNRELPHIMGQLLIMPKHWWEGTAPNGEQRDISSSTLEKPLGSGPYRIKSVSPGRTVTYERVDDYWAEKHPAVIGSNNFDEIQYDSYRDSTVLLEAFKGDQYDFRAENSAKNWATGYDFPGRTQEKVKLEKIPDPSSGIMQAFVLNLREDKFSDPRVRRALNYAFDFETTNKTVFFDQYGRIDSFFAGTELAQTGLPKDRELEYLETVRDLVPPELFTEPYANPVGGDPNKLRQNLRKSIGLLKEAGFELQGRKLIDPKTGRQFEIEFITADPGSERYAQPFFRNLERIGIKPSMRVIDAPQYIQRIRNRDFDMTTLGWGQSLSPGNEQRGYWGSESADKNQSRNYAGIKNPAIDKLIDHVIFAETRDDLVAATKALDRVLMWNNYVIPQWFLAADRIAYWDRFGRPDELPVYSHGFPTIWWWDEEKVAKTGAPK